MYKKKRITKKNLQTVYDITFSFITKVKYDHVSSFAGHAAFIFTNVALSDGNVLHIHVQLSAD